MRLIFSLPTFARIKLIVSDEIEVHVLVLEGADGGLHAVVVAVREGREGKVEGAKKIIEVLQAIIITCNSREYKQGREGKEGIAQLGDHVTNFYTI